MTAETESLRRLYRAWGKRLELCAEMDKLRAEGDVIWANAVISERDAKATMEWEGGCCTINGKETFSPDDDLMISLAAVPAKPKSKTKRSVKCKA